MSTQLPAISTSTALLATLLNDVPDWLTHIRQLQEKDVIILLSPIVAPDSHNSEGSTDPFEPLGRALSRGHSRIRQVPYTQKNGITSTHLGFIKRGQVIILCLAREPLQLELADIVFAVSDRKPVIVVCCFPLDTSQATMFPTIIQSVDFLPPALEAIAAVVFRQRIQHQPESTPESSSRMALQLKQWRVEDFDEVRDMHSVHKLWIECLDTRFAMDQQTLANLLRKPGYSKHYVIRHTTSGTPLGFCATFLSYVDRDGEKLVASLAALMVHPTSRSQGIGLSLHSHALTQLKRTRGIIRLQLGSTFPRILYGPPAHMRTYDGWFHHRGWRMDQDSPGQGQAVSDLILDIKDWQNSLSSSQERAIIYRVCTQDDMAQVLEFVEKVTTVEQTLGCFDQYWALVNGPNVKDIMVAVESQAIIGTALTYTPGCGSQVSNNIPWPRCLGNDVGGCTCICIYPGKREAILNGLLSACVENLKRQGMKRLFMDAVTKHFGELTKLGFREWARYRDVWKSV